MKKVNEIICAYRYDESNGMVDYFDTNFYYDIYTKPAAVKPTTPDDEPTKPAKEEPKEEPVAEETAPVQPAEQAQKVPETVVYALDDIGHDITVKPIGENLYEVEFREDGKRLGNPENHSAETLDFCYGIDVNTAPEAQNQPEPETAETTTESAEAPENGADIAYTANLRDVYENTLSRMERGEYYGSETETGLKMALEYLQTMPEVMTEEQLKHAVRLSTYRRKSHPNPEPTTESAGDVPEEVPETVEPMPEPVKPSPIREDLARRAHEMMSYSDYREGSATAEYNALCDRARTLAEAQKITADLEPILNHLEPMKGIEKISARIAKIYDHHEHTWGVALYDTKLKKVIEMYDGEITNEYDAEDIYKARQYEAIHYITAE